MQKYVNLLRQKLHKIPEIGFEETKTLEVIISEVKTLQKKTNKLSFKNLKGGLVVDYIINPKFPSDLFRADIDGLPITENTKLPYSSTHPGKMHACGHDTHAAMLLGAMKGIIEFKLPLKKNIRFIFQRAEENPSNERDSGGLTLVKEGILKGVRNAYALHIWANEEAGVFTSRPGSLFANSDRIKINISCTGGHVAMPYNGSNAIDIGIDIASYLKGVGTRILGPNQPLSMVPAIFKAGTAGNIRPSEVELWFSSRHFLNPTDKKNFYTRLERDIKKIVGVYEDASIKIEFITGHPATSNSAEAYATAAKLITDSGQTVKELKEPELGGEDFAHYLESQGGVPGAMFFLGAKTKKCGDHHTPKFNPAPKVFWRGVFYWMALATNK